MKKPTRDQATQRGISRELTSRELTSRELTARELARVIGGIRSDVVLAHELT